MSLIKPDFDYEVTSFSPGFLDTPEPKRLPIGATWGGSNAWFFNPGADGRTAMGKRHGARQITPSAVIAGFGFDGLYEFRQEGVAAGTLLAAIGGSLVAWDSIVTFNLLAAAVFTAGRALRGATFRNLALLTDGTAQLAWDGAAALPIGFIAPTGASVLTAVAPAGAGLTGTYQNLVVWYDSVHDHESSPNVYSGAVALAAQDRHHTKPAGAPPANVDKWRVYVRRTDTNEVYFKLVAEVAFATAAVTEAVTDGTRNLASTQLAPLPNQNDVPPTFAFMTVAQGYTFGVPPDSSDVHVSFNGDPQSYHPSDVLRVNRGDGKSVTTLKAIGTVIVAQKPRGTYQLKGDRMPFVPDELNGTYGNHSMDSSVEAAGRYWCWDDEKGPYKTDLASEWQSLVDGRIKNFVKRVNKTAQIRCVHYKDEAVVAWFVSTDSTGRLRTMLAYHYLLNAWLPPITGLEFGAVSTFQLPDGTVNLYVGDAWGRFYQYLIDDVEGVARGTLRAVVSSATNNTVTALLDTKGVAVAFDTTGDGLKGLPCAVLDASGNFVQWRTVASNTAQVLTIDTLNGSVWSRNPDATFQVIVGGIDWLWALPLVDFGLPMVEKRLGVFYAELRSTVAGIALRVRARLNSTTVGYAVSKTVVAPAGGGVWGGVWGAMKWGGANSGPKRRRLSRAAFAVQCDLSNPYPNEPLQIITCGITADRLSARWPR